MIARDLQAGEGGCLLMLKRFLGRGTGQGKHVSQVATRLCNCEYAKNHLTVHIKRMNFMVCELHFNKTVITKLKTGKQNKRLRRFDDKAEKMSSKI